MTGWIARGLGRLFDCGTRLAGGKPTGGRATASGTASLRHPWAKSLRLERLEDRRVLAAPALASSPLYFAATEDGPVATENLLLGATDADGHTLSVADLMLSGYTAGTTHEVNNVVQVNPTKYQFLHTGQHTYVTARYKIGDGHGNSVDQTAYFSSCPAAAESRSAPAPPTRTSAPAPPLSASTALWIRSPVERASTASIAPPVSTG